MKKIMLIGTSIGLLFLAGCGSFGGSAGVQTAQEESEPAAVVTEPTNIKLQKRFDATLSTNDNGEQNSSQLAQQYEELSIANNTLRESNHTLTLENEQLNEAIQLLESRLEQTEKDLAEANDFLGQMHMELNKWKQDVLGFRQEIRTAQQAQLEALGKILRMLGAEPIGSQEAAEPDTVQIGGTP